MATLGGNQQAKARPDQTRAFQSQQARPGEIHLPDHPFTVEGQVANGREVIEIGVNLRRHLHFGPRLL